MASDAFWPVADRSLPFSILVKGCVAACTAVSNHTWLPLLCVWPESDFLAAKVVRKRLARRECLERASLAGYLEPRSVVLASQPRWASKVARQASWQGSLRLSVKKRVEKTRCNLDGAVLRSFVSLLGNASLYDWAWVLRYDHNRKLLNSFCLSSRSLVPAEGVKWPVVWYLTRYSRKFMFLFSVAS